MITVFITTTNRPDFLRTALESVKRQTARHKIKEIIVSENSGFNAAETVCAEFGELPIIYKFRNPPVEAIQHLPVLLSETETECVAILHDDDWWHPSHLENGLQCLLADSEASAYWSSHYRVNGESSWLHHWSSSFWAGANYPPMTDVWKLDFTQVALSCLFWTPCHYSTLISYKRHLAVSCAIYIKQQNIFDNDRVLVAELSRLGVTYFNPIPEVFVRYHPGTDTLRYTETRDPYVEKTTDYLIAQCKSIGLDVKTELAAVLGNCPEEAKYFVFNSFERASAKALEKHDALPQTLKKYLASKRIKRAVKRIAPKVLFNRIHGWIYN